MYYIGRLIAPSFFSSFPHTSSILSPSFFLTPRRLSPFLSLPAPCPQTKCEANSVLKFLISYMVEISWSYSCSDLSSKSKFETYFYFYFLKTRYNRHGMWGLPPGGDLFIILILFSWSYNSNPNHLTTFHPTYCIIPPWSRPPSILFSTLLSFFLCTFWMVSWYRGDSNIRMSNAQNGARIKCWAGSGVGSGIVKNITFEHFIEDDVDHPLVIDQVRASLSIGNNCGYDL